MAQTVDPIPHEMFWPVLYCFSWIKSIDPFNPKRRASLEAEEIVKGIELYCQSKSFLEGSTVWNQMRTDEIVTATFLYMI